MGNIQAECPYCCFAFWCALCVSYQLRLCNDMSRYTCCAVYMPRSDRCGESKCPECFLCTEVIIQTQHKVEMDKRNGKFGPQPVMRIQHMSCMDHPVPPSVGYPPDPAYGQPCTYPLPPAYGQP